MTDQSNPIGGQAGRIDPPDPADLAAGRESSGEPPCGCRKCRVRRLTFQVVREAAIEQGVKLSDSDVRIEVMLILGDVAGSIIGASMADDPTHADVLVNVLGSTMVKAARMKQMAAMLHKSGTDAPEAQADSALRHARPAGHA